MKTVKEKTKVEDDDESFHAELNDGLKQAARDAMIEIQNMLLDKKVSDSTRFSVAKWLIERASPAKDLTDADEATSLKAFMEIFRQIRSSKSLASSKSIERAELSGTVTENTGTDDWATWIDSNLN